MNQSQQPVPTGARPSSAQAPGRPPAGGRRRSRRWTVTDIVVAAVLAAVCGVVFFIWNNAVYPATTAATVGFPPVEGLIGGMWLIAGVLGGLVIRKPGAALFCEVLAAVVSALLGTSFGLTVLLSGAIQGVGAELVFLLLGYRRFGAVAALLAGLVSGLFMTVSENIIYNYEWTAGFQWAYVFFGSLSGLVLAGLLAWLLTRALVRTGVLDVVAAGRDARATARGSRPGAAGTRR